MSKDELFIEKLTASLDKNKVNNFYGLVDDCGPNCDPCGPQNCVPSMYDCGPDYNCGPSKTDPDDKDEKPKFIPNKLLP